MPLCNCQPPGFITTPPNYQVVQNHGQTLYINKNVTRQHGSRPTRRELYDTAKTAYWTFNAYFWNQRNEDGGQFWSIVMGPSGVSMLEKVINILSYTGNRVNLDVGVYQKNSKPVLTWDVNYMLCVFTNTYGDIDDFKEWEWDRVGPE